jgi:hypothetical protein
VKAAVTEHWAEAGGSIVIITSTTGQRGSDIYSAYATSKARLHLLTHHTSHHVQRVIRLRHLLGIRHLQGAAPLRPRPRLSLFSTARPLYTRSADHVSLARRCARCPGSSRPTRAARPHPPAPTKNEPSGRFLKQDRHMF